MAIMTSPNYSEIYDTKEEWDYATEIEGEKEMERTQKDFWTVGRRGRLACIRCTIYKDGLIMANAESEEITPSQMSRALKKEHDVEFQRVWQKGDDTIYMKSIATQSNSNPLTNHKHDEVDPAYANYNFVREQHKLPPYQ